MNPQKPEHISPPPKQAKRAGGDLDYDTLGLWRFDSREAEKQERGRMLTLA